MVYLLINDPDRADFVFSVCSKFSKSCVVGGEFDKKTAASASVIFSSSCLLEPLFAFKTVVVLNEGERIRELLLAGFNRFVFDANDARQILQFVYMENDFFGKTMSIVDPDRFSFDFASGSFTVSGGEIYLTDFQKKVILKRLNGVRLNNSERVTLSYISSKYSINLGVKNVSRLKG